MKNAILKIEGIECRSHHGCLGEETRIGGRYSVDVIMELDLTTAIVTDDLNETADYVAVYTMVKEEMAVPSKIIEHVAGRILKRIAAVYEKAFNIQVRITKYNPPVNGSMKSATIEVSLK